MPSIEQVGAISKAQKYSRNNYWKHLKFFFKKNILKKSRTMPKNSKRGRLGSLNVFTCRKLQKKCKGVPFDRIRKFSKKKSHSAEKTQRVVSPLLLET